MLKALRMRSTRAELMDDFSIGGEELREALRELRRLNRIFAAAGPTIYGVDRLWREAGKPSTLSILDVGAGSGDVNRKLLRWADADLVDISILLVDMTEEACAEARILYQGEKRVSVIRKDLFDLSDREADVVTGTQFVHHFHDDSLCNVVSGMLHASRLGVVINDIHRHAVAWSAVWVMTRLLSSNRYILHDGPLSVAKGFRSEDWRQLEKCLGHSGLSYSWRPLFRYAVIIRKPNER